MKKNQLELEMFDVVAWHYSILSQSVNVNFTAFQI